MQESSQLEISWKLAVSRSLKVCPSGSVPLLPSIPEKGWSVKRSKVALHSGQYPMLEIKTHFLPLSKWASCPGWNSITRKRIRPEKSLQKSTHFFSFLRTFLVLMPASLLHHARLPSHSLLAFWLALCGKVLAVHLTQKPTKQWLQPKLKENCVHPHLRHRAWAAQHGQKAGKNKLSRRELSLQPLPWHTKSKKKLPISAKQKQPLGAKVQPPYLEVQSSIPGLRCYCSHIWWSYSKTGP